MKTKDLSKDQIRDIIQMKADGHTIPEIMKKYPTIKTRSTIYYHLYKAPAEKQNNMILLHKKLDEVLHRLQNIEQYLIRQGITRDLEIIQNNVQDTVQYIKPNTSTCEDERYIKTAEIVKLCRFIDGGNPSERTIQARFQKSGLKYSHTKKSYLLKEAIEILREGNQNPKAMKLDISELEKILHQNRGD